MSFSVGQGVRTSLFWGVQQFDVAELAVSVQFSLQCTGASRLLTICYVAQ